MAGYFAADGDVNKHGDVSINSAKRDDLEKVRAICTRIGIATTSIKTYSRKGFGGARSEIHRLTFFSSTLTEDFFLLSAHRKRFKSIKKEYERRRWQVVSVVRTRSVEPVYCAVVPHESHAFTLEDNILTGNCHGCKVSGHLAMLLKHYGLGRAQIDAILPKDESYQKEKNGRSELAVKMIMGLNPFRGRYILDEDILDIYRMMPTSLANKGYEMETLRHFEVGYDEKYKRITYPLRTVFGELVGISGRTIIPGVEPKYRIYDYELRDRTDFRVPDTYSMEEVKSAILWHAHIVRPFFFLKNSDKESIIITEGFKACMWTWQSGHPDVVALVGSYLTQQHAELLARATRAVTLFLDNNEAGIRGTHYAGRALLKKGVEVSVARYPDAREQPDDLDPSEVNDAVVHKESFRLWADRHRMPEDIRSIKRRMKIAWD